MPPVTSRGQRDTLWVMDDIQMDNPAKAGGHPDDSAGAKEGAARAPQRRARTRQLRERYINREISWLAFNFRVLEEANNKNHPLLERLRFLSISASNLDEFYMVRVAGLKGQVRAGVGTPSEDGQTPAEQLQAIHLEVGRLMQAQHDCWGKLVDELRGEGISVVKPDDLTAKEDLAAQIHGRHHAGADAACHRPGAPVPVHAQHGVLIGAVPDPAGHGRAAARPVACPQST